MAREKKDKQSFSVIKFFNSFDSDNESEEKSEHESVEALQTNQFSLTVEEREELTSCDLALEKIQEQLQAIYEQNSSIQRRKKNLLFANDIELAELLQGKLKGNTDQHKVSCRIDRIQQNVEVTISHCADKHKIYNFFNQFLSKSPTVKSEFKRDVGKEDSDIIVTFKLQERTNLIEGLKLSNEVLDIPSAVRYFQGC